MIPLAMISEGKEVRLVSVEAGRGLQSRLSAMGLVPGALLTVMKNDFHGPMLIRVNGSRYALGRGMGLKILVQ